jgi:hypothetical protein
MKRIALLVALCAIGSTSFARSNDPKPTTLTECTRTVLTGGMGGHGPENSDTSWAPPSNLGGGSATNYCQSSMNSFGTFAIMSHVGSLALVDNTFGLMCTGAVPVSYSWGMFTFGTQQFFTTFGNGYLCISPFPPGIYKMPTQNLGNGTVVRTITAHPTDFSLFLPGSNWNFQFWYRDRNQLPARFNLSDGLNVIFAP